MRHHFFYKNPKNQPTQKFEDGTLIRFYNIENYYRPKCICVLDIVFDLSLVPQTRHIFFGIWDLQGKKMAQNGPKKTQTSQICPRWRFEGSGGPKWLEQRGTKLERALGGPSFWTNLEERGAPKFPRCSNRLGPPEPSKRHFGQFGPIWAIFGGPWAKFGGTSLLQISPKTLTWTSQSPFQLCSTLFQPFRTNRTFKSPSWAYLAGLGHFWAVLGHSLALEVPNSKKKCVGFVEQGSGHPQLLKKLHLEQHFEIALDPPLSHCVNPL